MWKTGTLLKPEMLASMLILGQSQRQLVVPASAVVREENKLRFRSAG